MTKKEIVVVGADVQSDALGHDPGYPLPPPHDPPRSRFQVRVHVFYNGTSLASWNWG